MVIKFMNEGQEFSKTEDFKKEILTEDEWLVLIENFPYGIALFDSEYHYLYFNLAGENHSVRVYSSAIGKTPREILPESSYNVFFPILEEAKETRRTIHREEAINFGKDTVYVQATFVPLINERNEVYRIIGITRELKKKKLKENSKDKIIRIARVGSWTYNIEQKFIKWSEEAHWVMEGRSNLIDSKGSFHFLKDSERRRLVISINRSIRSAIGFEEECNIYLEQGRVKKIRVICTPEIKEGNVTGLVGLIQDITELESAEDSLRRLSGAVRQSPAMVLICDIEGKIKYVNPRFERLTGYAAEDVYGKNFSILKASDILDGTYKELWQRLSSGLTWEGDILTRKKSGEFFWVSLQLSPVYSSKREILHYLVVSEDISLRKKYEKKLCHEANYDSLTGLPNRALLFEHLEKEIQRAMFSSESLAVVYLGIDDFKNINTEYGRGFGDKILIVLGERLKRSISSEGMVARIGGDKYALVIPHIIDKYHLKKKLEAIRNEIKKEFSSDTTRIQPVYSFGVSLCPRHGIGAKDLMQKAIVASAQAEEKEKSHFIFYTDGMKDDKHNPISIESELRYAIQKGELKLQYQPIVALDTGKIRGSEALLRWKNPLLGYVSPSEFIPHAEEAGILEDLSIFVLNKVCDDFKYYLHRNENFKISINLSNSQISNRKIMSKFIETLNAKEIKKENIEFEISESLLSDVKNLDLDLNYLQNNGFQLSIDDVGTSFSSFGSLMKHPFHCLKIDKDFTQSICKEKKDKKLVQEIIELSHKMNIKVIAEGVEKPEYVGLLKTFGFDYYQGYYFMPPSEFSEIQYLLL